MMKRRLSKNENKKRIYLDYASSTPISNKVCFELNKLLSSNSAFFANPSSTHEEGVLARNLLEDSRLSIARNLQVHKDEIIFTSGATEANNLVILGVYESSLNTIKAPHIITSLIDHSAILEPIRALQKRGAKISFINPKNRKIISVEEISQKINRKTILISISLVNSELGTIAPVRDISRAIAIFKKNNNRSLNDYPYLHVDGTQAVSLLKINPHNYGADFMTFDGSKIYGSKGIGAIVALRERKITPIIFGGGQEIGLRPGTPNVVSAYALSVALSDCYRIQEKESVRLRKIQIYFEESLKKIFSNCTINGEEEKRIASFTNVCIKGLNAEYAVIQLDTFGISASSASACQSAGGSGFSYVVKALPDGSNCVSSSIRFSFGRDTKLNDVKKALIALSEVARLQKVSFYN